MNTTITNTKTNETNAKNGANVNSAATPNTSVPYRATLHPILRSLWNIPHVIQIPDPMPPPPQLVQLLREHLTRHQTQLAALTPSDDNQIALMANHKYDIAILQHKIEEVLRIFPEISLNALDANSATNHFSAENSGQNPQPLPTPSDPEWPESGQLWPDHGQDLPDAGQHGPDGCQTWPNTGQSTESAHASPSPDSENDQPGIQIEKEEQPDDRPDDDPDLDADDLDGDDLDGDDLDGDDLDGDDDDDLDSEEADIDAELAGYANDAERMAEAAADLQAHRKKRSRFDSLTPDDQAAIIVMLDTHDSRTVARTLAKPQPIGMNFKISKSGLNNWARRYKNRQAELRVHQNVKAAADLIDKSPDPDKAFQQALERLLRIKALTITSEPSAPLETIDALITTINKLRKQTLAERKQTHAESKSR